MPLRVPFLYLAGTWVQLSGWSSAQYTTNDQLINSSVHHLSIHHLHRPLGPHLDHDPLLVMYYSVVWVRAKLIGSCAGSGHSSHPCFAKVPKSARSSTPHYCDQSASLAPTIWHSGFFCSYVCLSPEWYYIYVMIV